MTDKATTAVATRQQMTPEQRAARESALATLGIDRATGELAAALGIEPGAMVATIKAQCFKGTDGNVSNEQLAALCSVAASLGLNPLLPGMLYAYPDGRGIMPMIGPDGMFKLLGSHKDVRSWETEIDAFDQGGKPLSATATIHLKDGTFRRKTVHFAEWFVEKNPNWRTRPCHMLEIRALKQCARQVIHGIPMDEDERTIARATAVVSERVLPALPPPSKEAGRRAAAERARTATPSPASEQASDPETPAKSPANAESGQPDGLLFPEDGGDEPGGNEAMECPMDGGDAFRAGFAPKDNPHIAEPDRKKWAAAFGKAADA